jgi:hypothetical protein
MDWKEVLSLDPDNRRARLAAEILQSSFYPTTTDKVRAFVQQGGGCRATFFDWRLKLNRRWVAEPAKTDTHENPPE